MRHVDFETANISLRAPPGMEDEVDTLRVRFVDCPEHGPVFRSVWKPEPEDIEVILAGGFVVLDLRGREHPPVRVGTRAPGEVKEIT